MSKIDVLPVGGAPSRLPSVFTINLLKVTAAAAAVAFVERKTPRNASGGTVLLNALPPAPAMPADVETKILAALVSSTSILLMALPLKQL